MKEDTDNKELPEASGVQELIDRLSQEGVATGERQAEQIVQDAREKADEILESARGEAAEIKREAREEADHFQAAGEEALRLAARDAVRDLGSRISDGWRKRLQELVQAEMREPDLIRQMILEIAGQVGQRTAGESLVVRIPPEVTTEEAVRIQLDGGSQDALTEFVHALIGEDLREGLHVDLGSQHQRGLSVRVIDQNVEIDLTDETIAALLARHLLPRYRAIMRKSQIDS